MALSENRGGSPSFPPSKLPFYCYTCNLPVCPIFRHPRYHVPSGNWRIWAAQSPASAFGGLPLRNLSAVFFRNPETKKKYEKSWDVLDVLGCPGCSWCSCHMKCTVICLVSRLRWDLESVLPTLKSLRRQGNNTGTDAISKRRYPCWQLSQKRCETCVQCVPVDTCKIILCRRSHIQLCSFVIHCVSIVFPLISTLFPCCMTSTSWTGHL